MLFGGGVVAAAGGFVVTVNPLVGAAAILTLLVAPLLLSSALARLLIVLVGALLVFESSQDVGLAKFAYLGLAWCCVAVSTVRVATSKEPTLRLFRPLVPATAAGALLLVISAMVAQGHSIPAGDWARDALPYLLLLALPVIGIDAALDLSPQLLEGLIGLLAVIGAVGLALDWLHRRGAADFGVERVLLATGAPVTLGFTLAITRGALGPRRVRWLLAGLVIVVAMLASGSRTNLVLLAGFAGVVGVRRKARVSLATAGTVAVATAAGTIVLLPWLATRLFQDPTFLADRARAAQLVLTGQAASDPSFAARRLAYGWVADQLHQHPWLGTGPGWRYPSGVFTLDTPLLVPAKFGLVGTVVVLAYLLVLVGCVGRCRRLTGYLPIHTAARGWAAIVLALTPLVPWLEDKGFALAVTLLMAVVAATTRVASHTAASGELSECPAGQIGAGQG